MRDFDVTLMRDPWRTDGEDAVFALLRRLSSVAPDGRGSEPHDVAGPGPLQNCFERER